ncbi:thiamine pyrophosphate-binding protein [Metallosphaera tengchongensis]|uniref:2-oxoacid oxidoreductase (ferredoxin) n=1 Tax=Metallosphaera tengchongensis TaxID=1532350 RepID=A0A6N0P0A6_9CREN|nr:thiamine pyrophosphate-binding protein [Metallosphaera tengchongensis]QKR00710.1 thiamine pyrophosphate-binding protein [Metallosphaera tengchongensis]
MKASEALLKMLEGYGVKHVFGLVGETSLPLYEAFSDFPQIHHVHGRDERNVVIMADAYARFSGRPGVAEIPGVGAPYALPGLAEANVSGIPIITFVSDIPVQSEKRNVLTEHDKGYLASVSKENLNVMSPTALPRLVRRAFRTATTGRTGPVTVRIPSDVLDGEVEEGEVYVQPEFSSYPSLRFAPEDERISQALKMLENATNPVMVCGQGVLLSHAEDEVLRLAEILGIPVGTTITGKGAFPETHPLSIGVIGARGGTKFSNRVVAEADVVFLIGTNTDSANTWDWRLPSSTSTVIQLDVSERELGNNYKVYPLLGDAKLTLRRMIDMVKGARRWREVQGKADYENHVSSLGSVETDLVNPVKFMQLLSRTLDERTYVVAEPGTGAIYSSAYLKLKFHGRRIMYNYSLGGLGYAIPASIGTYFATGGRVITLATDGNLFFEMGELETLSRVKANVKVFMFNNKSFGWIRAAMVSKYGRVLDGTSMGEVDFSKIAKSFNMEYDRIERTGDIEEVLGRTFKDDLPKFVEVLIRSEDKVVPPVPEWRDIKDGIYLG